jgi:hypothetical protein
MIGAFREAWRIMLCSTIAPRYRRGGCCVATCLGKNKVGTGEAAEPMLHCSRAHRIAVAMLRPGPRLVSPPLDAKLTEVDASDRLTCFRTKARNT